MLNVLELQTRLVSCALPSGFESRQAKVLAELARPYADEVMIDTLGNVICHRKGPGKRLMLPAHMDVIGFMVTFLDEHGYVRFEPLGGHLAAALIGTPVVFENGARGAIFSDAEVDPAKNKITEIDIHDLYIDVGAADRAEAERLCPVGSVCTFDYAPAAVAGGCMMTPYADNLASCIALLIAMSEVKAPANDLWFVFSVQEELGLRGAKAAAWRIEPDLGIAVDLTLTGDSPAESDNARMVTKVGAGPAIKIKDSSLLCNPQVIAHLRAAAKKAHISYQDEVLPAGGTDSAAMQRSREGVLSGCVSIPGRNIHTPGEIVSIKDVEQAGRLLAAACELPF